MATGNGKTNGAVKSNAGKKRVQFSLEAPGASEVYVCGTFNNWETRTPLKHDGNGGWKTQVMLPPGTYEYRLMVDGEWTDDPAAAETVSNPFGGANAVRTV